MQVEDWARQLCGRLERQSPGQLSEGSGLRKGAGLRPWSR